jgi:hypothetical protein
LLLLLHNHYCNFEGEESRTYHHYQTSSSFLRVKRAAQVVRGLR